MAAVRNLADLEWRDLAYGSRFGVRSADFARPLGAARLGYNVQEIPPGKASVPYHAHYVNEELVFVLDGEPRVRLDGAEHDLRRGDFVAIPPGASSAHQLLNYGDRPARALLASTMIPYEVVDYLDSGKRAMMLANLVRDPDREWVLFHEGQVVPHDLAREERYFFAEPFDVPLGAPPPPAVERDPRIVNLDEVDREPYRLGPFRRRVARKVGARLLGYSVYRLESGDRMWPYHFQHANEELALVLAGRATLRSSEGEREIGPGDAVAFPVGPSGAHGFTAIGDEPLEVLLLSTMIEPEISEYPDSEKIYTMVGSAPGGDPAVRLLDLVFRRSDAIPYETDEA